jgi:Fe-S cluster assembly protein SufD
MQVQIIERHQSLNENPVLTNSVTEIFAENVPWFFYKVQNDNLTANLIDNTYVSQQEESVAVNFSFVET